MLIVAPLRLAEHRQASVGWTAVYDAGRHVCHQRPERSFHLAGVQLPVCARCTGLYLSAAAAGLMAWVVPRRRGARLRLGRRGLLVLAAASLPTLLTVALEWAGILFPSNVVRAVWAVPLGAAAAWMSVRMLLAEADDGPVPGPAAHGLV